MGNGKGGDPDRQERIVHEEGVAQHREDHAYQDPVGDLENTQLAVYVDEV